MEFRELGPRLKMTECATLSKQDCNSELRRPLYARAGCNIRESEEAVDHQFEITADDPQLVLYERATCEQLTLKPGNYKLEFRLNALNGVIRKPKLYLDLGHGFRENPGECFGLSKTAVNTWCVTFSIEAPAGIVRLDPADGPSGKFDILELTIRSLEVPNFSDTRNRQREVAGTLVSNSNSFCILPFLQTQIMTTGAMKPCTKFQGFISNDAGPMSVYQHSFEEIWDSEEMKDIRFRMITNKTVHKCHNCHDQESRGELSARVEANSAWSKFEWANPRSESFQDLAATALSNDFSMPEGPAWIDLDLGNLCSLKCRTCCTISSSSIANDPVHSRWSTLEIDEPARWQGRAMVVGPKRALGVAYDGLSTIDWDEENPVAWMSGVASIRIRKPGLDVTSVHIRFSEVAIPGHPIEIFVNDVHIARFEISAGNVDRTFDLGALTSNSTEIFLRIECPERVGIEEVKLLRTTIGKNDVGLSRLLSGKQWFQDKTFLSDDLFYRAKNLTKIQMVGGEPLLIKDAGKIMKHLISLGVSKNIELVIVTSGAIGHGEILELASQFGALTIAVSIDGIGELNDYIRDGSNWATIDSNIRKLQKIPNVTVYMHSTIQAYNMFYVTELAQYASRLGMVFRFGFLGRPSYLSCFAMPRTARTEAALRIRRFASTNGLAENNGGAEITKTLLEVVHVLEANSTTENFTDLQNFIAFTNDLDLNRNQNFAVGNRELFDFINSSSVPWSTSTRFAKYGPASAGNELTPPAFASATPK